MGRSKALLPHLDGKTTFVAHAVGELRAAGLPVILVVGRHDDDALRAAVVQLQAEFVSNPDPDRGQLSSLVAGLEVADQTYRAEAVVVLPVDVPLITAAGIRALCTRAAGGGAILRSASGGRHGHPVLFTREVFDELRHADPALGARSVVRADPSRVVDVEVGEPGVLVDVDTPDDYRRAFGRPV
jgi:molybdenum cofactor cytidylyltransferase